MVTNSIGMDISGKGLNDYLKAENLKNSSSLLNVVI
jgi:hypothetical protein